MEIHLFVVLALVGASTCLTIPSEPPKRLPDFHCPGAGNFSNPDECESYIQCTKNAGGLTAYKINCPACTDKRQCPLGKLHFSPLKGSCLSAVEAKCPPRTECVPDCVQKGYCDCYDTCRKDNSSATGGRWQKGVRCDFGLFWNPDCNVLTGGCCDFWQHLSPATQETYRNDTTCVVPSLECYWEADPNCDNKYFYLPEGSRFPSARIHYSCPENPKTGIPLCWNQATLTCGNKCNTKPPKFCQKNFFPGF